MEETTGTCCNGCGCGTEEATECTSGTCDVQYNVSEDAKFATLLMLVPMLTLSAFNMMGLL